MPISKTDKTRKNQKQKFKTKIKQQMSEQKLENELNQIPQIQSYPTWASTEKIEVSGLEWQEIYNTLNIFRQALVAGESVMQRNLQNGKITMKYVDKDGKEVAKEQVEEYTAQMQAIFNKRKASEGQPKTPQPAIVNEAGKPYTEEIQEGKSENSLKAV